MLKTKVERRVHELKKRSVKNSTCCTSFSLALCISTTAFDQVLSSTTAGQHKNVIFGFVVVKPHALHLGSLDHLWMAFSHTAFHQSFFFYFSGLFFGCICWLDVNDIYLLAFRHASFVIIIKCTIKTKKMAKKI